MDLNRNYEEYNSFIDQSPQGSIYCYSWWLDAVAPGNWDYFEVRNTGGLLSVLPYEFLKNNGSITKITNPSMCQMMGVILRSSSAKYSKQLSEQKKIMYSLIDQFPITGEIDIQFHYSLSNWQPFYWRGFKQTTNYTYVLENIEEQSVWKELRSNIRTDIKKATKSLSIRDDLGIERFIEIYEKSFKRQKMKMPYGQKLISRLDRVCSDQNKRRISFALDNQNRIHAAIYTVWDNKSAYYIMGGADPDLRNSGAHSLLIWDSILYTSSFVQRFDFEGSMNENIEAFFRAFGGHQMPIINVYRRDQLEDSAIKEPLRKRICSKFSV